MSSRAVRGPSRSSSATRSWRSSACHARTATMRSVRSTPRIELRDRVRADPQLGDRLPIRIGVNTGEVVAGPAADAGGDGRDRAGDTLITGDAVNVAARLEQAAEPWTIVCGERTVRAAGDRFVFGQLDPVDPRGHATSVGAATLEGRATTGGRVAAAHPDRRPGRRPRPARSRRPPGVPRVASLPRLDPRPGRDGQEPAARGVPRSTHRSLPRRRGRHRPVPAVWPAADLLADAGAAARPARPARRRRSRPDPRGDPGMARRPGDADAATDAELLAATIGAGAEDATDRTSLFNAWRRAIELAALRRPLVLVVEDLHWSSDSLLDLVETILAPRADAPLLMIALSRPGAARPPTELGRRPRQPRHAHPRAARRGGALDAGRGPAGRSRTRRSSERSWLARMATRSSPGSSSARSSNGPATCPTPSRSNGRRRRCQTRSRRRSSPVSTTFRRPSATRSRSGRSSAGPSARPASSRSRRIGTPSSPWRSTRSASATSSGRPARTVSPSGTS